MIENINSKVLHLGATAIDFDVPTRRVLIFDIIPEKDNLSSVNEFVKGMKKKALVALPIWKLTAWCVFR